MIDVILQYASGLLLLLGCFFMLTGAIGVLRFPNFYARMHAAGITDTLATFLVISGLMLIAGWSLALFKLALIMLFIFFTSPTASHALARSAQLSTLSLNYLPESQAQKENHPSQRQTSSQQGSTVEVETTHGSRA